MRPWAPIEPNPLSGAKQRRRIRRPRARALIATRPAGPQFAPWPSCPRRGRQTLQRRTQDRAVDPDPPGVSAPDPDPWVLGPGIGSLDCEASIRYRPRMYSEIITHAAAIAA